MYEKQLQVLPINGVSNPYKEFTYTIADQTTQTIYYMFDFIQILSLSTASGVTLRFGASGTPTTIVGSGISYKTPEGTFLDRVDVINNSGGAITCTFGLCLGEIRDARFSTTTTLTVKESVPTFRSTANAALSVVTAQILAADSNRHEALITNTDTAIVVYIGDTNINNTTRFGLPLQPKQTAVIQTGAAIFAVSASGTPSVSISETVY